MDLYSSWSIMQRVRDDFLGFVNCLREVFVTYGIADELPSDGRPDFTAGETQQLLAK